MRRIVGVVLCAVLGAACGTTPRNDPDPDARTVEIGMHFSAFDLAELDVAPGETIRFVLTNTDPIDHEFIIGDREVQRAHELGTEPYHPPRPGEITIRAGETGETTFTFPDEPGRLLFGCHSPGHWDYGMRGVFVIVETFRS
jgi:uncharacterized cupredoxin-like copper-binding protein